MTMKRKLALSVVGSVALVVATSSIADAAVVNVPNSSGQCHYQSYAPGTVGSSVNGSAYYWCVNLGSATDYNRLFSMKITRNGVDVGEKTSTVANISKSSSLSLNVSCVKGAKYQDVSQAVLIDAWGTKQILPASYSASYVMC